MTPRIRSIKPSFFLDEDLAALPFEARLLFAGLWCLADKAGRLEDRPKRIHAMLFPYEPKVDVNGLLDRLAAAALQLCDAVKSYRVRTLRDAKK